MTHLEELDQIDAAIVRRNQAELHWAHDYCRAQMRAAIPNETKGRWKRLQRDVGRVLRELRLTEGHISAHEWSSYQSRNAQRECGLRLFLLLLEVFPPSEIEDWTGR